jgi:prepilin-type N-terminal cleavage/methylation domain-containing protein
MKLEIKQPRKSLAIRHGVRHAFSLIELLVVIGILTILASIVVVGISKMINSSRDKSTRLFMQNASGLLSEWQKTVGSRAVLPSEPLAQTVLPADLVGANRNGITSRLSRGVMFRLLQVSSVRKMAQNLPAENLYQWSTPNYGTDYNNPLPPHANPINALEEYYVVVSAGPPTVLVYYICFATHNDMPGALGTRPHVADQSGNLWLETSSQTPIFTDFWRNPLVFVPSCGFVLGNKLITSAATYPTPSNTGKWAVGASYQVGDAIADRMSHTSPWQVYKCVIANTGSLANQPAVTNSDRWVQIPTQPFWASAGADGNFTTPDDNIYSFEK